MAALTAQVLGFLGLFGIGLNAITAMVITTGIGVGAKFTIHLPVVIALGFLWLMNNCFFYQSEEVSIKGVIIKWANSKRTHFQKAKSNFYLSKELV